MQILAYGGNRPAPFQQGICESQALEPGITANYTVNAWAQTVALTACNAGNPNSESTLQCIRNLSLDTLLNATVTEYQADGSNLGDIWLPAVDGDFLPAAPSELLASGRFSKVRAMFGWTQNDATYFTDTSIATPNDTEAAIVSYLPNLNSTNLETLLSLYPITEFSATPSANLSAEFYRSARIVRDVLLACEPMLLGHALHSAGNDVYYYLQNQTILTPSLDASDHPGLGVIHTSELAYVFGDLSHFNISGVVYEPKAEDYVTRDRQSRSWSSFAAVGRPSVVGKDTLGGWEPAYQVGSKETRLFVVNYASGGLSALSGSGAKEAVAKQRLEERCAFINRADVIKQVGF